MKHLSVYLISVFIFCCLSCSDCDPLSDPGNDAVVQFFVDRGSGYEEYNEVPFAAIRGEFWNLEKSARYDTTFNGKWVVRIDTIDIPGFVSLDSLYSNDPNSEHFDSSSVKLLPLSFQRDSSTFSFVWLGPDADTLSDTLRIYHQHNILVNSPDCGFIDEFDLIETKGPYNFFDSVVIADPIIKLDASIINIEVYLRDTLFVYEGE